MPFGWVSYIEPSQESFQHATAVIASPMPFGWVSYIEYLTINEGCALIGRVSNAFRLGELYRVELACPESRFQMQVSNAFRLGELYRALNGHTDTVALLLESPMPFGWVSYIERTKVRTKLGCAGKKSPMPFGWVSYIEEESFYGILDVDGSRLQCLSAG